MSPQLVPRLQFNANAIQSIRGGGGHCLILDNCGQIYACGWNNRGQLGLDCTDDKNEFNCIPFEYFNGAIVQEIACGWDISGAITTDKELYVWGSNNFQQLGLCKRGFGSIRRPLHLNLPRDENVVKISFGLRHCAVLTDDNKIYVFGRLKIENIHSDLRVTMMPFNKTDIIKIQTDYKIDDISSGQNHLLIILDNRTRIIGIGDNKYGQSNLYYSKDYIEIIATGWTHNGILTKNNEIFLWGRNSYGQCGIPGLTNLPVPNKLKLNKDYKFNQLYLGSEHGLAVTSNGKILTWGWNEHGNCGSNSTENL